MNFLIKWVLSIVIEIENQSNSKGIYRDNGELIFSTANFKLANKNSLEVPSIS